MSSSRFFYSLEKQWHHIKDEATKKSYVIRDIPSYKQCNENERLVIYIVRYSVCISASAVLLKKCYFLNLTSSYTQAQIFSQSKRQESVDASWLSRNEKSAYSYQEWHVFSWYRGY